MEIFGVCYFHAKLCYHCRLLPQNCTNNTRAFEKECQGNSGYEKKRKILKNDFKRITKESTKRTRGSLKSLINKSCIDTLICATLPESNRDKSCGQVASEGECGIPFDNLNTREIQTIGSPNQNKKKPIQSGDKDVEEKKRIVPKIVEIEKKQYIKLQNFCLLSVLSTL